MKKALLLTTLLSLIIWLGAGYSATHTSSKPSRAGSQQSATSERNKNAAAANDRGAELFATHCGRCHKPPEDLSPRVVPAVLSHMRTRAMLSREDEELILKFLAP